eukprot:SM000060S19683  [mRNA]  locus=s60:579941:583700:- [translate_table: standard]
MSKNALKRRAKLQRYEEKRVARKEHEKLARHESMRRRREEWAAAMADRTPGMHAPHLLPLAVLCPSHHGPWQLRCPGSQGSGLGARGSGLGARGSGLGARGAGRGAWRLALVAFTHSLMEEREAMLAQKLDVRAARRRESEDRRDRRRASLDAGQNFVIDLGFAELMQPGELKSLSQQVMYCYASNSKYLSCNSWPLVTRSIQGLDRDKGSGQELEVSTWVAKHGLSTLQPNKRVSQCLGMSSTPAQLRSLGSSRQRFPLNIQRTSLAFNRLALPLPDPLSHYPSIVPSCRAQVPARLSLTSCGGPMLRQLERLSGFERWSLHRSKKSYMEVFEGRHGDLVYLTADSSSTVHYLEPNKIYIIGGIVDRNQYKDVTLKKAQEQGIATAKLPIGEFVQLTASKVLTINQVMDILLSYLAEPDWQSAFVKAVPQRKRLAETGCNHPPAKRLQQETLSPEDGKVADSNSTEPCVAREGGSGCRGRESGLDAADSEGASAEVEASDREQNSKEVDGIQSLDTDGNTCREGLDKDLKPATVAIKSGAIALEMQGGGLEVDDREPQLERKEPLLLFLPSSLQASFARAQRDGPSSGGIRRVVDVQQEMLGGSNSQHVRSFVRPEVSANQHLSSQARPCH